MPSLNWWSDQREVLAHVDGELLTKNDDEFLTFKCQNVLYHGGLAGKGQVFLLSPWVFCIICIDVSA